MALIDELTKSIETLTAEVAEMQTQMKRAGEDREMENSDFQKTVSDQRATKKILGNALEVLKGVYAKKSFMQVRSRQEPAGPPPPPGFKKYEQSSGAGGVLGMLEQVIADTETLEKDAIQAETDAQKGYEAFVKDTNKSIEEKNRDITNKSEQQGNKNEAADLHKACDFTLENFEVVQAATEQEMESLDQAKSVLQGSAMTAFLQRRH